MNNDNPKCGCQFCLEFANPPDKPNRILWQNDLFVLLPTIGSFTPGYLLLMPRRHVTSFACMSTRELSMASRIAEITRHQIEEEFGPCIVAEHGPGPDGQPSPACCDHAHWHLIPSDPRRVSLAYEDFGGRPQVLMSAEHLHEWNDAAYMFLSPLKNVYWVWAHSPVFPSQFVRRVCAKILGCELLYNWSQFPYYENMTHTRAAIGIKLQEALNDEKNNETADAKPTNIKSIA